jgi:hypothetical protein
LALRRRTAMNGTALLVVMLMVCSSEPALAAPQATSFSELMEWVQLGETVYVMDEGGLEIKGTLEQVSAEHLEIILRIRDEPLTLTEQQVRRIDLQFSDPFDNGAMIGLLAGVATAAFVSYVYCDSDEYARCLVVTSVFTAPAGMALGLGIDASHRSRRPIYIADPVATPPKLLLTPVISSTAKGVQVQFSW